MGRKNKQPLHKVLIGESIFWLHTAVLVLITVLGLFTAWYWVVIIILALRLQIVILHGCILTLLENSERGVKRGTSCYYLAVKRFFGIRLTARGVMVLSLSQSLLAVGVAVCAALTNTRIHL